MMKHMKITGAMTLLVLALVGGALAFLPGCAPVAPEGGAVVQSIACPDCGGTVVLKSAKGAEGMKHVCMFCKQVWKRTAAYADSGWVTVCQNCDEVIGACPSCQKKIEEAKKAAS